MCWGTRSFKDKVAVSSSPTTILFSEQIKRERKHIAKPYLEIAVGWPGDSASAPGCINPMAKYIVASPDHVLPLGQLWDRDRVPLCTAGGGVLPSATHHYGPAVPQSMKLHSVGSSYFALLLVHEEHSSVFRALPTNF